MASVYYKQVFTDRQDAMNQQKSKSFDKIHIINGEYCYKSIVPTDTLYSNMTPHTSQETDIVEVLDAKYDDVKIYRYITSEDYNKKIAPIGHDYKSGLTVSLYPKRTFNSGELDLVEWYADKEFTDLIIKVDIVYTRDTLGFALSRTTTRTWYREDGTEASPEKITEKIYSSDPVLQMDEGKKRRRNLVSIVNNATLGLMIMTVPAKEGESEELRQWRVLNDGKKFLSQYKTEYTSFVEDSSPTILDVIKNGTEYWWNNVIDGEGTTIRNYVFNQLNIYLDTPNAL